MARVKVPEPEKDRSERWLLTYADMITLLLALFVVLFATSKVDQTKFEIVAASVQRAFNIPVLQSPQASLPVSLGSQPNAYVGLAGIGAVVGPQILTYAQNQQLGDQISVTSSNDAVVITLTGALVYGSGSAELRPEGRQALEFMAGVLTGLRDRNPVRVEGFTDSVPPNSGLFPSNWDLSSARAAKAAAYLIQQGLEAERITAVGLADTRPIGDDDTPEGRTRNRRVEIWILPPDVAGVSSAPPAQIAPAGGALVPRGLPGEAAGH